MRHRCLSVFLTFVLCGFFLTVVLNSSIARAAVNTPSPDFDTPTPLATPEPSADKLSRDTVDISQPTPPRPGQDRLEREYFHPYRKAFTLRLGGIYSTASSDPSALPVIGGLQFFTTLQSLATYEAGADLISDGTGLLTLARRYVLTRTKFRPYLKFGGALVVVPSDQLVNFIKYDNYRLEGATGAEYLVSEGSSLRLEAEGFLGLKTVQGLVALGYVWAW
jgi:hypothetical protein